MGFECGIVGLPNVGKFTLSNTLTKAGIGATNFPFCTIEPNTGVAPIPDPRLDQLAEIVKPQRILSTIMEFIDIAGPVKGTSKGKGLGNQFLTNVRETEAIGYVMRCFENDNIIHVNNEADPADDIEVINTELMLSDLDICEYAIHRVQKKIRGGDKGTKVELAVPERCLSQPENADMLRALKMPTDEDKAAIKYLSFLVLRPTVYIVNVSEDGFENDPHFNKVRKITVAGGSVVVIVCAAVETGIAGLGNADREEFVTEVDLKEPGLSCVICASYELLNLQTYFTIGVKEVHAWTIPVSATAPQAAGKIHTDFKRGSIRVQTIMFEDFITHKNEQGTKKVGKICTEGKDYIVKDDDIMDSLFSV